MSTALTTNWWEIQTTHIYEDSPVSSDEHNRLLKAFGRGKQFVVIGFGDIELYYENIVPGDVNTRVDALVVSMNPGIAVQDYTVLDFIGPMKAKHTDPLKIYIHGFTTREPLVTGLIYDVGIRYRHGTIGDGIGRMPTYGVIESILSTADHSNFQVLYRLKLCEGYIPNVIDVPHINVDDYRNQPIYPPVDPWDPDDPNYPPETPIDDPEDEALMWALVFGGRW